MALRKVRLYGHLGKRFGKEFELYADTPAEAIRILSANFKDFKSYLIENSEPGYKVIVGKRDIEQSELNEGVWPKDEIKIIPYVVGSGGAARVIVGAALIYLSLQTGMPFIKAMGAFGTSALAAAGSLGWALVIGGVAQMLFAPPKKQETSIERPENKPSYSFDGPVNTIRQGNAVPVGYGRLRVGGQVISAGLFAVNMDMEADKQRYAEEVALRSQG